MKTWIDFVRVFAMFGLKMLGNIVVMIPILEEELVEKRKWVTKDDILDAVALGRCGPGAAVINTIAFLGNKIYGFWGGAIALFSFIFFPFLIILAISFFLDQFLENSLVMSAFNGILAALVVIIENTIIDLGKKTLKNRITWGIFLATLILCIATDIPIVVYILLAILVGIVLGFKNNKI